MYFFGGGDQKRQIFNYWFCIMAQQSVLRTAKDETWKRSWTFFIYFLYSSFSSQEKYYNGTSQGGGWVNGKGGS